MLLIYFNTVNIKIHLLYENKHQLHANIVFYQSSNLLGYKVYFLVINWAFKIFPLVINLQVRDTTDCLGLLSETLHVHLCR
jgi:hypothetical protein